MKYYVYLSDSKLEMLYSQAVSSNESRKRESLLGFDIKVLKGHVKESRGLAESKYERLDSVINSLGKSNLIGELSDNKPYIKGSLELAWSSYGEAYPPDESPITFWGGISNDTLLGLAGSKYHLLGKQEGNIVGSASLTPDIAYWLCKTLEIPMLSFVDNSKPYSDTKFTFNNGKVSEYDLANAVYLAAFDRFGNSPFKAKFEFVAKVLHRSSWAEGFRIESGIKEIVLGSPIYVAIQE